MFLQFLLQMFYVEWFTSNRHSLSIGAATTKVSREHSFSVLTVKFSPRIICRIEYYWLKMLHFMCQLTLLENFYKFHKSKFLTFFTILFHECLSQVLI